MSAFSATDLVAELLKYFESRWVSMEDMQSLAKSAGVTELAQHIVFFRELKQLVRLAPVTVFDDEQQRQTMIEAVQQALDKSIEEEG